MTVDGFNLLLAGIYLSANSSISVLNADSFSYLGTQGADCVSLQTDCVDAVYIDTGGGDDQVTVVIRQTPSVTLGIYNPLSPNLVLSAEDQATVNRQFEAAQQLIKNTLADGFDIEKIVDELEAMAKDIYDAAKAKLTAQISELRIQRCTNVSIYTGDGNDTLQPSICNHTGISSHTFNANVVTVDSLIGQDQSKGQNTVSAKLGKGTKLQSRKGSISIRAINKPEKNSAAMNGGNKINLAGFGISAVKTRSYLSTSAEVEDEAEITASLSGNVVISAEDCAEGSVEANSNTLVSAISADDYHADNEVISTVKTTRGKNVTILSSGNITVSSASDANLSGRHYGK